MISRLTIDQANTVLLMVRKDYGSLSFVDGCSRAEIRLVGWPEVRAAVQGIGNATRADEATIVAFLRFMYESGFPSRIDEKELERFHRSLRSVGKSSYVPSPRMAASIQSSMAGLDIPIGSSCERYELER